MKNKILDLGYIEFEDGYCHLQTNLVWKKFENANIVEFANNTFKYPISNLDAISLEQQIINWHEIYNKCDYIFSLNSNAYAPYSLTTFKAYPILSYISNYDLFEIKTIKINLEGIVNYIENTIETTNNYAYQIDQIKPLTNKKNLVDAIRYLEKFKYSIK